MLTYKEIDPEIVAKVQNSVNLWLGCPYVPGGYHPKFGADCLRSVSGVLSLITGKYIEVEDLPQDIGMHNRKEASKAMRKIRRSFMPNAIVKDLTVEAGDVIVTSWINGGPGHAMICGNNALYHCPRKFGKFCKTGLIIPSKQELARIYRYVNKEEWLQF